MGTTTNAMHRLGFYIICVVAKALADNDLCTYDGGWPFPRYNAASNCKPSVGALWSFNSMLPDGRYTNKTDRVNICISGTVAYENVTIHSMPIHTTRPIVDSYNVYAVSRSDNYCLIVQDSCRGNQFEWYNWGYGDQFLCGLPPHIGNGQTSTPQWYIRLSQWTNRSLIRDKDGNAEMGSSFSHHCPTLSRMAFPESDADYYELQEGCRTTPGCNAISIGYDYEQCGGGGPPHRGCDIMNCTNFETEDNLYNSVLYVSNDQPLAD